jgi:hypothetical protein
VWPPGPPADGSGAWHTEVVEEPFTRPSLPFSMDGGIHEVPIVVDGRRLADGRMWLCGKHVAAPDPGGLLSRLAADAIACLVETHEVASRWPEYPRWLAEHDGTHALRYPIGDFGAPPLQRFRPFLDSLVGRLRDGQGIVVHCAGGIGRSGTTAVAVLMLLGADSPAALRHVRAHRPMAGPEVGAQRQLIDDLAYQLAADAGG